MVVVVAAVVVVVYSIRSSSSSRRSSSSIINSTSSDSRSSSCNSSSSSRKEVTFVTVVNVVKILIKIRQWPRSSPAVLLAGATGQGIPPSPSVTHPGPRLTRRRKQAALLRSPTQRTLTRRS
ncbi:hypothetical protein ElyMa_005627600 [Elysia marginata]|uniref:Secreted protein n=1 Tax=Elysia marginata TaxID=1093978 RepID=A0AAV4F7R3_9GAST|nr:hypothetical protein ElyMa_005627600 [Elysia marginata]